jgi:hypothetical protein
MANGNVKRNTKKAQDRKTTDSTAARFVVKRLGKSENTQNKEEGKRRAAYTSDFFFSA